MMLYRKQPEESVFDSVYQDKKILKEFKMLYTILLVILILLLLGALPTWPYSASWGYYPSGGFGLLIIILLILLLLGKI